MARKFEYGSEVYEKAFPHHPEFPSRPSIRGYISYGLRFPEACAKHAEESFHASRVYVIVSRTLATSTSAFEDLKKALGSKMVSARIGMTPHTLFSECVEITNQCRELDVDLIITLGGGSLSDAGKIIRLALANNVSHSDHVKKLPIGLGNHDPNTIPPTIPLICIPTTLSAGEHTNYSGATEDSSGVKYQFSSPLRGPDLVILDPELTMTTPDKYWLSTGVRGIDHAVETLCSLVNSEEGDIDSSRGLKALIAGLLRCHADGHDLEARFMCQMGVKDILSGTTRFPSPTVGASHGIGHMLGPMGVGHGETSCVVLPAVCKFNAAKRANIERQQMVVDLLWTLPEIQPLNLDKEKADLGDILDAFFRALGMPRTLKSVGVEGSRVEQLAENTLQDDCALKNPYPLRTKEDVMEILELCSG